ncbi:4933424G06Rik [Phodopus roborovskii]|uniref:4933424G06Rik protein n=1 Tax=Phodopus roborovskii TaxID=109678 RepID=A0AAV0A5J5_PHORO|nr:4933424G06Rik [Phodopus roborovskii]
MSGTVFFSFVLFLGSEWGVEPHSISMTEGTITSILSWQLEGWKTHREPQPGRLVGPSCRGWDGVENGFPSSSKHLDEDLAKLFDEILLQVFPSHLDDVSKDATTAGRLITWSDVNETQLSPNSFNNSELASSSHKQEEHLAKIFDEILLQVSSADPKYLSEEGVRTADEEHTTEKDKESSLFNRDVSHQLITPSKAKLRGLITQDAHTEGLPCRQMLSFLQKNIIIATTAVAAVLLVTVLVVFVLVTYIRRKQPRYPPMNTTYNIFIMNGKGWWQKSEEKHLRKFTGKQKHLKSNSFV